RPNTNDTNSAPPQLRRLPLPPPGPQTPLREHEPPLHAGSSSPPAGIATPRPSRTAVGTPRVVIAPSGDRNFLKWLDQQLSRTGRHRPQRGSQHQGLADDLEVRSEERRVGKECRDG